jgi:carbon-monoxide dehydrogenase medium subunit
MAAVDAGAGASAAAELAAEGTAPPDDLHAGADYRAHLARVLVRRALVEAGVSP